MSTMSCERFPQQQHPHHREQQQPQHLQHLQHPPHGRRRRHRHDQSHWVETRAILKHMRRLEATTYQRPTARNLPEPFKGLWRQQIVEWMYTLVKYCDLRHESAAAASYYLDVAAERGLIRSPNDYQLGAMTALYLALKVYDSPSMRVVKLSSLVKLGNGEFQEQDVLQMERDLVTLLDWHLNPPTPNCFLQQYLTLLPSHHHKDDIETIALQAIEHTVARDLFLAVPPSVVGYSVLLTAIEAVDQQQQQQQQQSQPQQQHHTIDQQQPSQLSPTSVTGSTFMNLMDLQTFLWNMSHVSRMDNKNPYLVQTSILLDRTMKCLPIPVTYTDLETMCCCIDPHHCSHENHQQDDGNVVETVISNKEDLPQQHNVICHGDPTAVSLESGQSPNHVALQGL
jgi:hypothetical protein